MTYSGITIDLWVEDAIVLFDWLSETDLDALPAEHKAVKQALTDLYGRLEQQVPYLEGGITPARIAQAQHEVSKDMGW